MGLGQDHRPERSQTHRFRHTHRPRTLKAADETLFYQLLEVVYFSSLLSGKQLYAYTHILCLFYIFACILQILLCCCFICHLNLLTCVSETLGLDLLGLELGRRGALKGDVVMFPHFRSLMTGLHRPKLPVGRALDNETGQKAKGVVSVYTPVSDTAALTGRETSHPLIH